MVMYSLIVNLDIITFKVKLYNLKTMVKLYFLENKIEARNEIGALHLTSNW